MLPRIIDDDAEALALLRQQVATFESPFEQPWTTGGLDDTWLASRVRAIVAFEIPITRLEAKAKMSQNRPTEREHVAAILEASGQPAVADEIRSRAD